MYVDGFVLAVPTANKQKYIDLAAAVWTGFKAAGALRLVECWGDDVPDGKLTSFPMAVKREPDETVVFSWVEWPDKATRDAAHEAMRMEDHPPMPFDGARMIYGGFTPILDVS